MNKAEGNALEVNIIHIINYFIIVGRINIKILLNVFNVHVLSLEGISSELKILLSMELIFNFAKHS